MLCVEQQQQLSAARQRARPRARATVASSAWNCNPLWPPIAPNIFSPFGREFLVCIGLVSGSWRDGMENLFYALKQPTE
jgi:hypothetical protein